MGITLAKDGIDSVSLPFPAHNQEFEPVANQSVHRSASGVRYVVKHGPTYYRITRTFEFLSDQEIDDFIAFWNAAGQAANDILYEYTPKGGSAKSVPCRIIEQPRIVKVHRDNWNLSLRFEQDTVPTRHSDPNA